jgi:hypothetical protein
MTESDINYYKYLKYKQKYLDLVGGKLNDIYIMVKIPGKIDEYKLIKNRYSGTFFKKDMYEAIKLNKDKAYDDISLVIDVNKTDLSGTWYSKMNNSNWISDNLNEEELKQINRRGDYYEPTPKNRSKLSDFFINVKLLGDRKKVLEFIKEKEKK